MNVRTGLDRLITEKEIQNKIKGRFAYLAHAASVDRTMAHGVYTLKRIFPQSFTKILGPQHGLFTNCQDNMIETKDFIHPFFKLPVYSLYSHTRIPTTEILEGIDTIVVDLQDVGTRVYTYIQTLSLVMESIAGTKIKLLLLDRPNPIGGTLVEGNILEQNYRSFVGRFSIPQRHGMTMGEVALWLKKFEKIECNLEVVPMANWTREMSFEETGLPWILPSPNLPNLSGCFLYPGLVHLEGTNISEGRGTTRPFEIIGHPDLSAFSLQEKLQKEIKRNFDNAFYLRPLNFIPTFNKHCGKSCGGFQIHFKPKTNLRTWKFGIWLSQVLATNLNQEFSFTNPPYEYEYIKTPIDIINGSDKIRNWITNSGDLHDLEKIECESLEEFKENRDSILLYRS